ncbi:MAG: HEPN domain-containing protein [Bacteroidaceae bacterium]|nr:HEPN domain-containing protein [Bacteroidaceae bacterium]
MSLEDDDRKTIVEYRIEKAYTAFHEAETVANIGLYSLAINRLYYSIYYAASALLVSEGIISHTHKGLLTQLSLYYVKAERISEEEGKIIRQLFNMRNEDDYSDFIEADKNDIDLFMPKAKLLLNKLVQLNKLANPRQTT